ncbi:unnamed protein product [Oppiella nova]|uniref:Uncharacterized protein n=1 Tax=Oppiella nova TaxID=334625 RepID=A0A7R9LES8_9ACAR|nr:unnamed protein product [Oppiella nova]CAG2162233.1 unnamed protein product [Oppiella nova]
MNFTKARVKGLDVEVEENAVDSVLVSDKDPIESTNDKPVRPTESATTSSSDTDSTTCFLESELFANKDFKPMGQPICTKIDDKTNKYDITVSFNDLMGVYEWKVFNLFGYNFTESAFITIREMLIEFVIVENMQHKSKLDDLKVGKIDGLKVNVNIPERIASTNFLKPMLEYIISRISTTVANGSMDSIVRHMRDVFYDAIQDKIKIKP